MILLIADRNQPDSGVLAMRYWKIMLGIIGCVSVIVFCMLFLSGVHEYRALGGSLLVAGALLFLAESGVQPDLTRAMIRWLIAMCLVVYAITEIAPETIKHFKVLVPFAGLITFLLAMGCRRVYEHTQMTRQLSR